jgi:leucyl-tRNA synthetase
MNKYFPKDIEGKWQEKWLKDGLNSPDMDRAKKPYYALMMFPYPSAEGLHVGNMYAFTGTDMFARYMRMQGYDVFEPMGLDGFGIHSENYALKINRHPMDLSKETEKRFYAQLMSIGNAFDWRRTVETYKPEYYKWTQWVFLKMYEHGLAYKKKADVNWCPSCKTVLADEQVIAGKCERCSNEVEKRELEQWFFKITDYAERLLKNLDTLDWSEKVKIAQRNWIGKKSGINITYHIDGVKDSVTVFTTRPDTNFGATFIALAPEHEFVRNIINGSVTSENGAEIKSYVKSALEKKDIERQAEGREKTGVFTGYYAMNELDGYRMPIWVSDFVLGGFGTGALVGVPGHDKRDFDFATKFNLEIKRVVVGRDGDTSAITSSEQVQEDEGTMINSGFLDGMEIHEATEKIMDYMEKKGYGKRVVTYHLRDWLISRQRYWGPPIPIIYCEKCGVVPVPEKDLPVVLPYVENFRPTGTGISPLASDESFYKVACPKCGADAKRETDVSDTFLDSAWYFYRYTSTEDNDHPWKPERVKKWVPVDTYIGGAEHSVLHLLYSRFVGMVFKDIGLISHFEEPFTRFRAHGLIISGGAKMSKSKGNVINPDDFIKEYGADTLRTYLMFLGPYDQGGDFRVEAIAGPQNFLRRVWQIREKISADAPFSEEDNRMLHQTVKRVGNDLAELRFNTAISAMMEWLNHLSRKDKISENEYLTLVTILAPFAPHLTEEIWSQMGNKNSIHLQPWPKVDESAIKQSDFRIPVQVAGRLRAVLVMPESQLDEKVVVEKALADEAVKRHTEGKTYKVIYVKGKVLNFVITG